MTPTYAYNHGLRYRYYACSNHIRSKSCGSTFKTIPAEDVEQKVVDEVLQILRFPEVTVNVAKIVEEHAGKCGNVDADVSKQNLILALRNLTDVWSYLYPTEQHKVVGMLVEDIAIEDEGIRLKMNLQGFDRVMREVMVA